MSLPWAAGFGSAREIWPAKKLGYVSTNSSFVLVESHFGGQRRYSLPLLAYAELWLNALSQPEKETFGRESHMFIARSLQYIEMRANGL